MHRTMPDLLLSGANACTRAALLSIHNFEILNGPVERSLRRHGTDPALSGASGEIRVPAVAKSRVCLGK